MSKFERVVCKFESGTHTRKEGDDDWRLVIEARKASRLEKSPKVDEKQGEESDYLEHVGAGIV